MLTLGSHPKQDAVIFWLHSSTVLRVRTPFFYRERTKNCFRAVRDQFYVVEPISGVIVIKQGSLGMLLMEHCGLLVH